MGPTPSTVTQGALATRTLDTGPPVAQLHQLQGKQALTDSLVLALKMVLAEEPTVGDDEELRAAKARLPT